MQKNTFLYLYTLGCALLLSACDASSSHKNLTGGDSVSIAKEDKVAMDTSNALENSVLTQAQQQALKPEDVFNILMQGNNDFVNDRLTIRNTSARVRAAALSQYPKAVILSCLDSRVPVEDVFHRGIGDVFVARVAGNIVDEDILGSLEYGCKVSGARVIMVLGHEHCGAIKSAIDNVKLGNITALLSKIQPAVDSAKYDGERTSKNEAFVHEVCEQNVRLTIKEIRKRSPILAEMEKNKELIIAGAVYNMNTGEVIAVSND